MNQTIKTILKVVGIVAAVAAAAVGAYLLVTKVFLKKKTDGEDEIESFVTCSCIEDDDKPIVVEDPPKAEEESIKAE